jgi:hypothetical protein
VNVTRHFLHKTLTAALDSTCLAQGDAALAFLQGELRSVDRLLCPSVSDERVAELLLLAQAEPKRGAALKRVTGHTPETWIKIWESRKPRAAA